MLSWSAEKDTVSADFERVGKGFTSYKFLNFNYYMTDNKQTFSKLIYTRPGIKLSHQLSSEV